MWEAACRAGGRLSGAGVKRFGAILQYLPLVLFPLILLWRPLFAGEAFFWGTPLLQFIPWQRLAASMWRSGHLPLWNSMVGCGAPLAANYQTAAFYPLNALHLVVRSEVALSWTVALHIGLTGLGMYRWGRAIGLDQFPALIGALALEGSGLLVGRAALFPSIVLTFPWIPIWLWRAEALVKLRRGDGMLCGVGLRNGLWLGLALGLGLLAGHAQTGFYGGLLTAVYLVVRTVQEARGRKWAKKGQAYQFSLRVLGVSLLSLLLGVCLAAVQLVPTTELLLESQRSTGADYRFAMTYSFWPWRAITFVAPDFFGNPGRGSYWGYATYWEDAGYVGLLPLLLAVGAVTGPSVGDSRVSGPSRSTVRRGPCGRSLVGFWSAGVTVSLVLALGKNTPVFPLLFQRVPGLDLFRAPARWLAVTTVGLAALAAIGAQQWWPKREGRRRRGLLGATVGGALLVGGMVAPRMAPDIPSTFGPATARLGGMLILVGAMVISARRTVWWQKSVLLFVAVDLLVFGWPLIPTVDRSLYRGDTATATIIKRERADARVYWPMDPKHHRLVSDAHYRVKFGYLNFRDFGPRDISYWWGMREAQLPNVGLLDGLPSASHFDPLLVGRYADMLRAALKTPEVLRTMGTTHVASDREWSGGEPVHSSGSATFYRLPSAPGRAWAVPAARYAPPEETMARLTAQDFDPLVEVLLEGETAEETSAPCEEIRGAEVVLQDGPNRVTIRATIDAPGYVVLADTWYPGWQATVDGEPAELLKANHAFRAVHVEAGEHRIEMRYRPTSIVVGGVTSLATLGLLILGLLVIHRERVGV
jgi:hypothetical protein